MLFDSAVRKDLSRTFAASLVVVLTIVITMFLIRALSQAANGAVAPQDVALLLGYTALSHLPTMMALSMFVAVVLTLGRMYRDSEMVIWFASGVGLRRFLRPVAWTAVPVLLAVAAAMLFAWPWVNQQTAALKERYSQRSDLARVTPGVFQSSADGSRVFFVERQDGGGLDARNFFALQRAAGAESIVTARNGRVEQRGADRFIVLERGQRTQLAGVQGDTLVATFDRYAVLADDARIRQAEQPPVKATPTWTLLRRGGADAQGELAWRLGIVLAAANLLLLAVGLAATNPRRPSSWSLLFALLAFIVYFNLVTLSQGWVAAGRTGLGAALLLVHGGALAVGLALLYWRDHELPLRALLRRPRAA